MVSSNSEQPGRTGRGGTIFSIPTPDAPACRPCGRLPIIFNRPTRIPSDVFSPSLIARRLAKDFYRKTADLQAGVATTRYVAETVENRRRERLRRGTERFRLQPRTLVSGSGARA